jgi:hypothetical protein
MSLGKRKNLESDASPAPLVQFSAARRIKFDRRALCLIHQLPEDILELILEQLNPRDLMMASRTCKRWFSLDLNYVWYQKSVRAGYLPPETFTSTGSYQAGFLREQALERDPFLRYLPAAELPSVPRSETPPPYVLNRLIRGSSSFSAIMEVDQGGSCFDTNARDLISPVVVVAAAGQDVQRTPSNVSGDFMES